MIKVLVAFGEFGRDGDDWNWCGVGERVVLPTCVCADPWCRCRLSFTGLASRRG